MNKVSGKTKKCACFISSCCGVFPLCVCVSPLPLSLFFSSCSNDITNFFPGALFWSPQSLFELLLVGIVLFGSRANKPRNCLVGQGPRAVSRESRNLLFLPLFHRFFIVVRWRKKRESSSSARFVVFFLPPHSSSSSPTTLRLSSESRDPGTPPFCGFFFFFSIGFNIAHRALKLFLLCVFRLVFALCLRFLCYFFSHPTHSFSASSSSQNLCVPTEFSFPGLRELRELSEGSRRHLDW